MTTIIASVATASTVAAYLWAVRGMRLRSNDLALVWVQFLECVGLAIVFGAVNTFLVVLIALFGRITGVGFLSLYVAGDSIWILLAMSQAILLQLWRNAHSAK